MEFEMENLLFEPNLRKQNSNSEKLPELKIGSLIATRNRRLLNTSFEKFQKKIEEKFNVKFESYWDFHKWTIENYIKFWDELWQHIGIIASKGYDEVFVKTGSGFLDNEWFRGARFNVAENILRIRDTSIAIICLDERGNEESITFADLYEEVKLYAAAFRKNGLEKGDKVACYMSNRKEQVFALLAVASIGAIWGGPQPCCLGKAASKIISMMDPKFLITVDIHQDEGKIYNLFDNIPIISQNAPTLEKIILVVTEEETLKRDLSSIKNLVLLKDFLKDGKTADGMVPDIVFEQLPTSHPRSITFTSGTTGNPKGVIHSPASILLGMGDFLLYYDMKKGDVIMSNYPTGWILLEWILSTLALGCKILLYSGSQCYNKHGVNFWNVVAKYKVSFTFMPPAVLDKLEKTDVVPSPGSNFDNFKIIYVSGCTMKKEHVKYLHEKVKSDLYIDNSYGFSESFGVVTGFNFNIPAHMGENQVPCLGFDIQCFNSIGQSVIDEFGEIVFCTPNPSLPIGLLKDLDNCILNKTYLKKYPGVWCTNDIGRINSSTRGLIVVGRRNDILVQNDVAFTYHNIYNAIHGLEKIEDYSCVGQKLENGESKAILFVKLKKGVYFTSDLKKEIECRIREEIGEKCVPETILEVPDIPYSANNKKLESVISEIVATNRIPEVMTIKNPDSLYHFLDICKK